jgi:hypothetical protein
LAAYSELLDETHPNVGHMAATPYNMPRVNAAGPSWSPVEAPPAVSGPPSLAADKIVAAGLQPSSCKAH